MASLSQGAPRNCDHLILSHINWVGAIDFVDKVTKSPSDEPDDSMRRMNTRGQMTTALHQ